MSWEDGMVLLMFAVPLAAVLVWVACIRLLLRALRELRAERGAREVEEQAGNQREQSGSIQ